FGLQIDPVRTADASSILRVPGSFHHGVARRVEASPAIERFDVSRFQHLQRHLNEQDRSRRVVSPAPKSSDSPIAAAITGSIGNEPSDPNGIVRGCQQIARWRAQPGAFGEPFNRLVAGVFKNADATDVYLGWLDPSWRDV